MEHFSRDELDLTLYAMDPDHVCRHVMSAMGLQECRSLEQALNLVERL